MKSLIAFSFVGVALITSLTRVDAQPAAFTYQGRVTAHGTNFNGVGQFKFALVTSTNVSQPATAIANMGGLPPNQFVSSCTVTFGGNGYVSPPAVNISGGGGSGATAQANLSGSAVGSITVLSPGGGYSSAPTVTVAPPPPSYFYTNYWSNDGTSVNGSEPTAAVSVSVNNGLFTVVLGDTALANMTAVDPAIFAQPNLQLRIWFSDGASGFAALSPLQNLTPSPYAMNAGSANNLLGTVSASQLTGSIPASQISGTLTPAQLPATVLTNSQSSVSLAGAFTGNGAGLTNLSFNALALSGSMSNRVVVGWGYNANGQADAPMGLNNAVAVAAGGAHSLAVRNDGTVVAWGWNGLGQTNVPAGLSNVIAVAAGLYHSVALRNTGTVVAWGDNSNGETNVPAGLNNVIAVAAGGRHNLALRSNGTIVGWGWNIYGQTNVPAGLTNVIAVGTGGGHSLAVKNDGTVVAWGFSGAGATNVPVGLSNVIAVAAGDSHALALKNNGTIVAWGNNGNGQTNVPAGLSNVIAVAAGSSHSLALKADGTIVTWGWNGYGQTNVPAGRVVSLGLGCTASHALGIQNQIAFPAEWPDTFNGLLNVNGFLTVNGRSVVNGPFSVVGSSTVNGFSTVNGSSVVNGSSTINGSSIVNGDSSVSGSFGIGTTSPTTKLDVRGDIRLGNSAQYFAPGASENLRIIRGTISGGGAILAGSGFSVVHQVTGIYAITFSSAFAGLPTITATVESGAGAARIVTLQNVTTTSANFYIFVPNTAALVEGAFHFTAIGPR